MLELSYIVKILNPFRWVSNAQSAKKAILLNGKPKRPNERFMDVQSIQIVILLRGINLSPNHVLPVAMNMSY